MESACRAIPHVSHAQNLGLCSSASRGQDARIEQLENELRGAQALAAAAEREKTELAEELELVKGELEATKAKLAEAEKAEE